MKIACWSGPRNISTAFMRSWSYRDDTTVIDEPFYSSYLISTKLKHPMYKEIIKRYPSKNDDIIKLLTSKNPNKSDIWYQKHMAQHNLYGYNINWISDLKNCVLIRDPKYVIASYGKQFSVNNERLLGYIQQIEIIKYIEKEHGKTPPIIDATDILKDPEKYLKRLCDEIEIEFSSRMLSWPKGGRDTDGVWAPYWYSSVNDSTGFKPYEKKEIKIDHSL